MSKKRNDYFLQRGFTAEFRAAGADDGNTGHIVEGVAAVCEQETRIQDFLENLSRSFEKARLTKQTLTTCAS